jgi:pimeloyl-ACP methyl ester carboxylesterase
MTNALRLVAVLLPAFAVAPARAESPKLPVPAFDQSAVAKRGYFYVGGKYVGEAVLTHSQSGSFGWLIADARPSLVKAIVAVEPAGPPFENAVNATGKGRAWGPTDIPITYDPPVKDPGEIAVEREAKADGPDLFVCWMQKTPARQLVNLKNIPVMVMSAEASYHQVYDHCTAKYLAQAGVKTELIRLQDKGIHGNGHMVMLEKNNLDIAHLIDEWVQKNVK